VWLPYSKDLSATEQYETFLLATPPLRYLAFPRPQEQNSFKASFVGKPIQGYAVSDELYVSLRHYNMDWYDQLTDLPDRFDKEYVLLYKVTAVQTLTLHCYCPTFDEHWRAARGPTALNAYWCYAWGSIRNYDPSIMVLITPDLCRAKPSLISSDPQRQQQVLKKHFPSRSNLTS
jgi:hypothetical protein